MPEPLSHTTTDERLRASLAGMPTDAPIEQQPEGPRVDKAGKVRVVNDDGRTGSVPLEKLDRAAKFGWHAETGAERTDRLGGSALGAAALGAGIGAADMVMAPAKLATATGAWALRKAGLDVEDPLAGASARRGAELLGLDRETQEAIEAKHGTAYKAGEIGGQVAGGLGVGGVFGELGAGATSLGEAAGLGHGAAHLAGEVASGALEGGALGASQASEQAWVKNEKLTAEHAMQSVLEYALWGGGSVAGFRAAGKSVSAVKDLLRQGGEAGAATAAETVEGSLLERAAAHADRQAADAAAVEQPSLFAKDAEDAAPHAFDDQPPKKLNGAQEWLTGYSNEAAVKAVFRGDQVAMKRLGIGLARRGSQQRIEELGQLLNESGIVGGNDAAMLEKARALAEAQGPKIDAIVKGIDAQAIAPDLTGWLNEVDGISAKLREDAVVPEDLSAADFIDRKSALIRQEAVDGNLTFSRLREFRKAVDKRLKFNRETPTAVQEAQHALRSVTEQEIERGVARLGQIEPAVLPEYLKAKKLYGVAMDAMPALAKRVERRANANLPFGLHELGWGTVAGVASGGNPLALAAPFVAKIARERYYSAAAVLARRIAGTAIDATAAPAAAGAMPGLLHKIVAAGEQRIAQSVTGFLSQGEEAVAVDAVRAALRNVPKRAVKEKLQMAAGDMLREHFAEHSQELKEIAGSPDVAQDRLEKAIGKKIPEMAPNLHAAMAAQAGRVVQYLQQNIPGPKSDAADLAPHLKKTMPVSDAEIRNYAQVFSGATDPMSLLDDMHDGRVSPAKAKAVRDIWPEVHASIARGIYATLTETKKPVSHAHRLMIDTVLGANGKIEPSLDRRRMAAMRQAAQYLTPKQQQPHGALASGKSAASANLQTLSQRIAAR